MSHDLRALADLVQRRTGLRLSDDRLDVLGAALRRAEPDLDLEAFLRLARDPTRGAQALDRLVEELAVKETSFFRERRQLEDVDWAALHGAAVAAGAGTVRAWVAACATGEEAYTLAILACEAFAPLEPPVRILATDLSEIARDRAREGRYRARALRELEPELRERYFHADGDEFVVVDRLRRLVAFRRHNLVEPAPPLGEAPFDLICCRNVLIYFDGETVERVIGGLEGALTASGNLLLGSADALCGTARRLVRLEQPAPSPRRDFPGAGVEAGSSEWLARVLSVAGENRAADALSEVAKVLEENPLDAEAYFVRALVELGEDRTESAISSLRRALYVDPAFGLAAFKLGRALDAVGHADSARRAYERALRTLAHDDRRQALLGQVELGDVEAACRTRIGALS